MYGYFKGVIEEISEAGMVLEVNGIGYNISMPQTKCFDLGAIGDSVKVYTYTNVREDAINLFGFTSKEELNLFKLLISVSGVGPKSGQELLNTFKVSELENAIIKGDAKEISKAPGVGKKSAERIILELKDKVSKLSVSLDGDVASGNIDISNVGDNKDINEAVEALMALGYSKAESTTAVNKAKEAGYTTSEELLRGALKNL